MNYQLYRSFRLYMCLTLLHHHNNYIFFSVGGLIFFVLALIFLAFCGGCCWWWGGGWLWLPSLASLLVCCCAFPFSCLPFAPFTHQNKGYKSLHLFNLLPEDIKNTQDRTLFKSQISALLTNSVCSCSHHPLPYSP